MERLHDEIAKLNGEPEGSSPTIQLSELLSLPLPEELLTSLISRGREKQ